MINIENVKREIENIKLFANDEQKSKLNFEKFNANFMDLCIYGQMCKSCLSPSAHLLKEKCCIRKLENRFTELENFIMCSSNETNKNIIEYIKNETNELRELKIREI